MLFVVSLFRGYIRLSHKGRIGSVSKEKKDQGSYRLEMEKKIGRIRRRTRRRGEASDGKQSSRAVTLAGDAVPGPTGTCKRTPQIHPRVQGSSSPEDPPVFKA